MPIYFGEESFLPHSLLFHFDSSALSGSGPDLLWAKTVRPAPLGYAGAYRPMGGFASRSSGEQKSHFPHLPALLGT